ncbi:MAG TPA: pyrimidine dimer DNA glycosylase/endonuclease V, partial [Gammaproteobacteria bacterium]
RGYRFHPQLARFQACRDPVLAIGCYLDEVAKEADRRGYRFDAAKIAITGRCKKISVQRGQIEFEWRHLLRKLKQRNPDLHERNRALVSPRAHPGFSIVPGGIEDWERP